MLPVCLATMGGYGWDQLMRASRSESFLSWTIKALAYLGWQTGGCLHPERRLKQSASSGKDPRSTK